MTETTGTSRRRTPWRLTDILALLVGVITAIAAIAVPLYIYFATEQHASLTLRYISSQALVNINPRSAGNVRVTYDGVEVRVPWLLTLTLENTGEVPIDAKDVKDFLSITFPSAKILQENVTITSPPEISTKLDFKENAITVWFDLLNPHDSFSFDILLDGEPVNPKASFRMIGKYIFSSVPFVGKPNRPYITWPRIPENFQSFNLITGSLSVIFIIGGGIILLGVSTLEILADLGIRKRRPAQWRRARVRSILDDFRQAPYSSITIPIDLGDQRLNILMASLGVRPETQWLENPDDFAKELDSRVPKPILDLTQTDSTTAARALVIAINKKILSQLAQNLWAVLPSGVDLDVRGAVEAINPSLPMGQIVSEVTNVLSLRRWESQIDASPPAHLDSENLIGLVVSFLIIFGGGALLLTIGATWENYIAF
jgi:hypothetical protein